MDGPQGWGPFPFLPVVLLFTGGAASVASRSRTVQPAPERFPRPSTPRHNGTPAPAIRRRHPEEKVFGEHYAGLGWEGGHLQRQESGPLGRVVTLAAARVIG